MIMGGYHVICVMAETFLYNFMISAIVTEVFYAWVCYFAFMTFSSCIMYTYIGLLFLGAGMGILNIFNAGGWFLVFIA